MYKTIYRHLTLNVKGENLTFPVKQKCSPSDKIISLRCFDVVVKSCEKI